MRERDLGRKRGNGLALKARKGADRPTDRPTDRQQTDTERKKLGESQRADSVVVGSTHYYAYY